MYTINFFSKIYINLIWIFEFYVSMMITWKNKFKHMIYK
jgi:hypothetical protein